MKKYCRLTLLAATLLAVSCQFEEILPETPSVESSIKIIGVIAQPEETKLDFTFDSDGIVPSWSYDSQDKDKCDRVIGFDGDGNKFELRVSDVVDEEASFAVESGNISNLDKTYYAIYYPNKGAIINNKTLEVDLSEQNGNLDSGAPALMLATSVVENEQIKFVFHNQTAIVGIKKIQIGDSEKGNLQNDKSVSKVSLSGIATSGTIEVKDGKLALTVNGNTGTVTASGSWTTDSEKGQIDFTNGGSTNPLCFVVLPCENAYPVINATCEAGTFTSTAEIGVKSKIEVSNYYSISGKKLDVSTNAEASVTIDNKTTNYATLSQAIDAAYYSSEAPTIKLLKNVEHNNQITLSNVNYMPIVLDLNGKTLSTETASFITTSGTLTITGDNDGKGEIHSSNNNVLYLNNNTADVKVKNCLIKSTFKATSTSGSNASSNSIVYLGSGAKMEVSDNAKIWATDAHVCYAAACTLNIDNAELTSSNCYCIYVNGAAIIDISGESTSFYSNYLLMYCNSTSADIAIKNGYFYRNNSGKTPISSTKIDKYTFTGGHFSAFPTSATADIGYVFTEVAATHPHATIDEDEQLNYVYQVKAIDGVACIGTSGYETLKSAIEAANGSDEAVTVTLLDDLTLYESITIRNTKSKRITLDLNGHILTGGCDNLIKGTIYTIKDSKGTGKIESGFNNIINHNVPGDGAKIILDGCKIVSTREAGDNGYSSRAIYNYSNKCTLTLKNGATVEAVSTAIACYSTNAANAPKLVVEDGTITAGDYCVFVAAKANVTVQGGSFYSGSKATVYSLSDGCSISIEEGFFYRAGGTSPNVFTGGTGCLRVFSISGGTFSSGVGNLTGSEGIEDVKPLDPPVSHKHPGKGSLYYGYRYVTSSPASTSDPVGSLGEPKTGGVSF